MILSLDPGPTPGAAVWEPFNSWTFGSPDEALDWLQSYAPGIEEVAIEDFIIQAGWRARTTKDSKLTLEMIGAVAYLCRKNGIPMHRQLPADAASFSTNEKLEAVGFKTPSKPDHERSAARHLLLRLTRNGAIDPLSLIRSLQH